MLHTSRHAACSKRFWWVEPHHRSEFLNMTAVVFICRAVGHHRWPWRCYTVWRFSCCRLVVFIDVVFCCSTSLPSFFHRRTVVVVVNTVVVTSSSSSWLALTLCFYHLFSVCRARSSSSSPLSSLPCCHTEWNLNSPNLKFDLITTKLVLRRNECSILMNT